MSGLVRAEGRFRARRRAARRRTARPVLAAAVVTTVVGGGAWAATSSPLLRLDSVVVHGVTLDSTSRLSVADVEEAAAAPIGRSLLQVHPGRIQAHVAALPPVAKVQVRRLWPHRLEIDVVERTPVAVVTSSGELTMVDHTGVAFAAVSPGSGTAHLLDLRLGAPLPIGGPPDSPGAVEAHAGLSVWQSLPSALRVQVPWVSAASANGVSFGLPRGVTVVWGSPTQTADKLAALTALLRHRATTYDVSTPSFAVTSG